MILVVVEKDTLLVVKAIMKVMVLISIITYIQ